MWKSQPAGPSSYCSPTACVYLAGSVRLLLLVDNTEDVVQQRKGEESSHTESPHPAVPGDFLGGGARTGRLGGSFCGAASIAGTPQSPGSRSGSRHATGL